MIDPVCPSASTSTRRAGRLFSAAPFIFYNRSPLGPRGDRDQRRKPVRRSHERRRRPHVRSMPEGTPTRNHPRVGSLAPARPKPNLNPKFVSRVLRRAGAGGASAGVSPAASDWTPLGDGSREDEDTPDAVTGPAPRLFGRRSIFGSELTMPGSRPPDLESARSTGVYPKEGLRGVRRAPPWGRRSPSRPRRSGRRERRPARGGKARRKYESRSQRPLAPLRGPEARAPR